MTLDEIAAWEAAMLANHDLADLADCVQMLRSLSWSVGLSLKPPLPAAQVFVWFEDLHEFAPLIYSCSARPSSWCG